MVYTENMSSEYDLPFKKMKYVEKGCMTCKYSVK